jgi:adenylate cyclase
MNGAHGGRIFKLMGDGLLAEFSSVVEAARCAVHVQRRISQSEADKPEKRRIQLRIGVHVGDVIIEGDDLHGDGVNTAARLEGLAEPGGVWLSQAAHEQVRDRLDLAFADMGEHSVKNMPRPLRAWRVALAGDSITTPGSLPVPDKPSIIVLPFVNMSGDPQQEFFADGMTEDITTALSRLRWFFVIARNSAFTYKGRAVDVKRVAAEMGVRYVLEGSVRKAGNRIRITAQLIDAETSTHIWADRFDRDLADIFAIQDEITASIVSTIEPELYAAESGRAARRPPEDLNSWERVTRAVIHIGRFTAEDFLSANRLLDQAVAATPSYAQAHCLRALIMLWRAVLNWGPPAAEVLPDVNRSLQAAAELEGDDAWFHAVRAFLHFTARRPEDGLHEIRRSLDLNPNFVLGHLWKATILAYSGASDDALAALAQGKQLSPRDPFNRAFPVVEGVARFLRAEYSLAANSFRTATRLLPGLEGAHRFLAAALAQMGELDEARRALQSFKALNPSATLAWAEKTVPLSRPEDRALYVEGLRLAGLE